MLPLSIRCFRRFSPDVFRHAFAARPFSLLHFLLFLLMVFFHYAMLQVYCRAAALLLLPPPLSD